MVVLLEPGFEILQPKLFIVTVAIDLVDEELHDFVVQRIAVVFKLRHAEENFQVCKCHCACTRTRQVKSFVIFDAETKHDNMWK